jgi:hypothetical protein
VLHGSVNRHLVEFNVVRGIIFVSLLRFEGLKRQERNYDLQKPAKTRDPGRMRAGRALDLGSG